MYFTSYGRALEHALKQTDILTSCLMYKVDAIVATDVYCDCNQTLLHWDLTLVQRDACRLNIDTNFDSFLFFIENKPVAKAQLNVCELSKLHISIF
jgi:hypothetical protein